MGTEHHGKRLMQHHRGFSKFELVICIVVITLVATLLYSRYRSLAEDAEQAAVQGVIGWLQAGINMRTSLSLSRGDMSDLNLLENSNPMVLVATVMVPPSNYLGELTAEAVAAAKAGSWYYDLDRQALVYRFRYISSANAFNGVVGRELLYHLKVRRRAADSTGRSAPLGLELVSGVPTTN